MNVLSQEFLCSCRRDGGRILRGENMSRIETFVDAAFAFSFTMLVISIDQIPRSPEELLVLSRDIPAFVFSAAIIGSIWRSHVTWSRTFGLQDGVTVLLSLSLVVLVLIFVYPIKLMIQASVLYLSDGAFGMPLFDGDGWTPSCVASLFVYFSLGLIVLSAVLISLYMNALRFKRELVLSDFEIYFCKYACVRWVVVVLTAIVSILTALYADDSRTSTAGFVYNALLVAIPASEWTYRRLMPAPVSVGV